MDYILESRNLFKSFVDGDRTVEALKDVNFKIKSGELVVILGPSGAGKSTLLNMIGGMDSLSKGNLFVSGKDISRYTPFQLTNYRRTEVGFVFQFYNLMPNLTALENVELATELCKDALDPKKVLSQVGLKERLDNFPSQLSGGEQQRVSIARAIAKNPKIILCDEPTGALDYQTGKEILSLLSLLSKKDGKTVIIVTHNSALSKMANHLLRIKNGQIVLDEMNDHPMRIEDIEW